MDSLNGFDTGVIVLTQKIFKLQQKLWLSMQEQVNLKAFTILQMK